MSRHKNIEDLFRQELSGLELSPSLKVWKKVRSRLAWKSFMQFDPYSFNIYYASLLILAAITVIFVLTGDAGKEPVMTYNQYTTDIHQPVTLPLPEETESMTSHTGTKKDAGQQTASPSIVTLPADESSTEKGSIPEKGISQAAEPFEESGITEGTSAAYLPSAQPRAWFDMSAKEGCTPLKVTFMNYSGNAVQYSWSFGDGGTAAEKDPAYVFDEPGVYFITLTATGAENRLSTYTDTVRVNALPAVRFEADVPQQADAGVPVNFYNYTRDAVGYKWYFGDGSTSELKDPSHSYSGAGSYHVKLVATTAEGCMDSMVIRDILKAGEPDIKFPTAFSPNMAGPVGGNYTGRESNHEVFYPYTSELPVEYRLRIFNRNGILVFESSDINTGWDGYCRQELQPPGVYVWKVRARYADGRTVVKAGDVTLLWRQ